MLDSRTMQTLQLRDGTKLPALGLGTWLSEPETVYRAVRSALEVGYRHIDCAWIYLNEGEVGRALHDALQAGDVAREDLWITTKLWNDAHAPADVQPALERSMKLLQLEYVDLYLMHWPVALRAGVGRPQSVDDYLSLDEMPLETTWEAMTKLPATGLTRQVGVSNFSASKIERITRAVGIAPSVDQVELHPYNQQRELLEVLRSHQIVATAYSPLGSAGRPDNFKSEDERRLLDDPTMVRIAQAHGATPAQVAIAWALARGTAVIPKSTNPDRIAQNFAAAKLDLQPEDMDAIAKLEAGQRYVDGSFWCPPGSPYTMQELWG